MPTMLPPYAAPLYIPKFRAFTAAGTPLAGGSVGLFIAGTSTPFATYPTYANAIAGTSANAHPVPLDANGEADIFLPVTTSLVKAVLKDSGGVTQWTVDSFHPGVGYPGYTGTPFVSEWRPATDVTAASFTFVSATSFRFNSVDVTGTFIVGRRVKTTNSGGTAISTVLTSTFAAGNTTLTLTNISGSLDAGLSAVYFDIDS